MASEFHTEDKTLYKELGRVDKTLIIKYLHEK